MWGRPELALNLLIRWDTPHHILLNFIRLVRREELCRALARSTVISWVSPWATNQWRTWPASEKSWAGDSVRRDSTKPTWFSASTWCSRRTKRCSRTGWTWPVALTQSSRRIATRVYASGATPFSNSLSTRIEQWLNISTSSQLAVQFFNNIAMTLL